VRGIGRCFACAFASNRDTRACPDSFHTIRRIKYKLSEASNRAEQKLKHDRKDSIDVGERRSSLFRKLGGTEEYENREKSKAHLITWMPFMEDTRGREAANFVRGIRHI